MSTLTTLSPVIPKRQRSLSRRLWFVRCVPGIGRPLLELRFIHYGRWAVLKDLPAPDGKGGKWPLNYRYLFFASSYDGSEEEYLDAFSDTLPLRLIRLWGTCFGFEEQVQEPAEADGRVLAPAAFRRYVQDNELTPLYVHAAYPHESVITVGQAIAMSKHGARATRRGRIDERAARRLATMALGPGPKPSFAERATLVITNWVRAVRRRYGVSPLTVFLPIKPGERAHLEKVLGEFDPDGGVPGAHFARFVIISEQLADVGQPRPDRLPAAYLLFLSDHIGKAERYLEALSGFEQARNIWCHCAGYPDNGDPQAFRKWMKAHTRPTKYFVWAYPPRTVAEIRRNLEDRKEKAAALTRLSQAEP